MGQNSQLKKKIDMKSGNRWHAFIFHPTTWSNRRGAALLIALTFLVLLSAVVLALFGTTRTDRQNASTFATGQETMRLADAAVNLVQGQIRDATIQPRVGWASQPGMIRTFGTSGNATTAYKLYSSDEMVVSSFGQSQINAETAAMATWNTGATGTSYNALYCDLNSPAAVKRPKPGDDTKTEDTLVFPIADPAAMGAVEGFSANTSVAGTVLGNGTNRRLPMPVKWIYVLRDGQMTAPTSGNSANATFSGSVVPTQANPIVGRIAFWADDETCKLNINTASEGSFWDAPKASTSAESRMSIAMPVQGEFNRLAGHPATTSLSAALGDIIPSPDALIGAPGSSLINNANFSNYIGSGGNAYYQRYLDYFNMTPRINGSMSDRGSRGGTRRTSVSEIASPVWSWGTDPAWVSDYQMNPALSTYPSAPILPDSDRLYITIDELLFKPDRTSNNPALTSAELSKRDFFLTAQSRAPETTLFGTPRISLWPINTLAYSNTPLADSQQPDRTAKDMLINFCASIGKNTSNQTYTYSFQRSIASADGTSVTFSESSGDLQKNSLAFVNQAADSPTADSSLPRNRNLVAYLRNLGSGTIPGYGSSFALKWSSLGVDRAIAQSFDIIRAKTSTDYISLGNATFRYSASFINPRKKVASTGNGNADYGNGPRGYVIPTQLADNTAARGAGNVLHVTELPVIFQASEVVNTQNGTVTFEFNPGVGGPGDTTTTSNVFTGLKVVETTASDGRPTWRHDPSSMKTLSVNRSSATPPPSPVKFEFRGIFKETSNGDTVSYELQQGELKVIDPSGSPTPNEGAPADPTPPLPLPTFDPGTQANIAGTALNGDLLLGSAGPPVIQTKGNRGAFERIVIEPANPITIATGYTNLTSSDPGFLLNASDHYQWGRGFVYTNSSGGEVVVGHYDNFKAKAGSGDWSVNAFGSLTISGNITAQQTTKVRAFLLPQIFNPNPTPGSLAPSLRMELVNGNNLQLNGTPLFRSSAITRFGGMVNQRMWAWTDASFPNPQYQFTCVGYKSIYSPQTLANMFGLWGPNNSINPVKFANSNTSADMDSDYPFVSKEIPVTGTTMNFSGGSIQLKLQSWKNGDTFQNLNITFPQASGIAVPQHLNTSLRWEQGGKLAYFTTTATNGNITSGTDSSSDAVQCKTSASKYPIRPPTWKDDGGVQNNFVEGNMMSFWKRIRGNGNSNCFADNVIRPGDVVCSMFMAPSGETRGDYRMVAVQTDVPASWFSACENYGQCTQQIPVNQTNGGYAAGINGPAFKGRFAHNLIYSPNVSYWYGGGDGLLGWRLNWNGKSVKRDINPAANAVTPAPNTLVPGVTFGAYAQPLVAINQQGAMMKNGSLGDWASGVGPNPDGAYMHSPDSGSTSYIFGGYFLEAGRTIETGGSYEPNRSVPSAGFLGTILTTDSSGSPQPWQTLLFNPVPAAGSSHAGFSTPKDHLWLDNFWMPVAEPYPISDPLSTRTVHSHSAHLSTTGCS